MFVRSETYEDEETEGMYKTLPGILSVSYSFFFQRSHLMGNRRAMFSVDQNLVISVQVSRLSLCLLPSVSVLPPPSLFLISFPCFRDTELSCISTDLRKTMQCTKRLTIVVHFRDWVQEVEERWLQEKNDRDARNPGRGFKHNDKFLSFMSLSCLSWNNPKGMMMMLGRMKKTRGIRSFILYPSLPFRWVTSYFTQRRSFVVVPCPSTSFSSLLSSPLFLSSFYKVLTLLHTLKLFRGEQKANISRSVFTKWRRGMKRWLKKRGERSRDTRDSREKVFNLWRDILLCCKEDMFLLSSVIKLN